MPSRSAKPLIRRAFCAAWLLSPGWTLRAEFRMAFTMVRPMLAHSGPLGLCRPMSDHILRRANSPSVTTNSQFRYTEPVLLLLVA